MATQVLKPTDVPALSRMQSTALIVAVVGLVGAAVAFFTSRDHFFQSWLIGFIFCLGLTLGSLGLLMLQHLTGGQWGYVGRRIFESGISSVIVTAAF